MAKRREDEFKSDTSGVFGPSKADAYKTVRALHDRGYDAGQISKMTGMSPDRVAAILRLVKGDQ